MGSPDRSSSTSGDGTASVWSSVHWIMSAGTVNFISRKPGDELDGYATLEVGNFDYFGVEAATSIPFSESLKGRLAVQSVVLPSLSNPVKQAVGYGHWR